MWVDEVVHVMIKRLIKAGPLNQKGESKLGSSCTDMGGLTPVAAGVHSVPEISRKGLPRPGPT